MTDRRLSRRAYGALAIASSLSLAGCSDVMGGDDDGEPGDGTGAADELAGVPAAADGALFADEKMATDEETAPVLTGLITVGTDLPQAGDSEITYATLVIELASSEVSYIDSTFFYREDNGEEELPYQAAVVRTDGDSEAVSVWVESTIGSLTADSYDEVEVSITETDEGELWLAEYDPDTVILGSEPAVTDAIAVMQGTEDGLSGPLKDAYDAAGNGHMKALVTLGDGDLAAILEGINESLAGGIGLLPDPQIMTALYATDALEDDGGALLDESGDDGSNSDDDEETTPDGTFAMQLTMESTEDAESFTETIELVLDGDDPIFGDELEDDDLLSRLVVDRDGEHVTVAFPTTSEELAEFFNGSG